MQDFKHAWHTEKVRQVWVQSQQTTGLMSGSLTNIERFRTFDCKTFGNSYAGDSQNFCAKQNIAGQKQELFALDKRHRALCSGHAFEEV